MNREYSEINCGIDRVNQSTSQAQHPCHRDMQQDHELAHESYTSKARNFKTIKTLPSSSRSDH